MKNHSDESYGKPMAATYDAWYSDLDDDMLEVLGEFADGDCAIEAIPPHSTPYSEISSDLPYQIVSDMRNYLAPYKVELPDIEVIREFSPNLQFVSWDD